MAIIPRDISPCKKALFHRRAGVALRLYLGGDKTRETPRLARVDPVSSRGSDEKAKGDFPIHFQNEKSGQFSRRERTGETELRCPPKKQFHSPKKFQLRLKISRAGSKTTARFHGIINLF